jgi:hypothetical protein
MGDRADTPFYDWGDAQGEPYYHRDVAGIAAKFAPWVSTATRFSERLTSKEFVRATAENAALIGLSAAGLTGCVAWGFGLPWQAVPVVGVSAFAVSIGVLVALNRSLIHKLVAIQDKKGQRNRQELHIQVDTPTADGKRNIEFMCVAGITKEQVYEFIPMVLDGASMAVHAMSGGGKLFSQPQYASLMSELQRAGKVSAPRGNIPRMLTVGGRHFFEAVIKQ